MMKHMQLARHFSSDFTSTSITALPMLIAINNMLTADSEMLHCQYSTLTLTTQYISMVRYHCYTIRELAVVGRSN
jgi:hypothetical protein